ncbi:hypothetical protein ACHAWX_006427 [Stephanocyclus meneghinianus]
MYGTIHLAPTINLLHQGSSRHSITKRMFMQSFDNSDKQQRRRHERQLAMQRMQNAAQLGETDTVSELPTGIFATSAPPKVEDEQQAGPDPSSRRVSQLLRDIVGNPGTLSSSVGRLPRSSYKGGLLASRKSVAPNGTRFSVLERTAQQFLWDEGSVASGPSTNGATAMQVNLHDIKNSLSPKPTKPNNRWNRETSLRWSAINAARQHEDTSQKRPVSEGLWNALPLFGGGNPPDYSDTASVKSGRSSTSSKYRDEEGERLLDMAAKRLNTTNNRNGAVSMKTSIEAKEYGENNSFEDDDEETEFRRRVILDKEGNLTYDDDNADLHSRRMHNYYRRSLKHSMICILTIGVCIGIMVTFGMLTAKRLIGRESNEDVADSANSDGASMEQEADGDDEWYQEPQTSERFHSIKARLLETEVTHPSAFDDIHSAQYAALKWIADDDPRQLDPSNAYLTQRYGLVVLWFSTTETEYEWHIPAEYGEAGNNRTRQRTLKSNNGTSFWSKHRFWLTEKGICEWEGVKCHSSDDEGDVDSNTDGDVSRIEMRKNNMHGLMCKEIYTTLPHLTYVDMSDNGFTGILSSQIGLWNELTYLNFSANRIGGSIPREIGEISQLKVLHFADNLLGESIPHTVGDLARLRDLDLSGNELKGTIPYEMGQLESLISLNLASNLLMGQIPHEFSRLTIVTLDVGNNNLGGPIPTEIGLMSHLETLRLNDNHFSGAIPTEIGQLVHLNELHMNNNDFVGVLPSELSSLLSLDFLVLANNHLEGACMLSTLLYLQLLLSD